MIRNNYIPVKWSNGETTWYMFGPTGSIVTGLYEWYGSWYYFSPLTYEKVVNSKVTVGNVDYYLSDTGSVNDTVNYNNTINSYIVHNHINHANIQTYYVIPQVTGSYRLTGNGKPNMVVVHETANPNDSIWGEINYEKNTYNHAFVHAFVDGNNIIEISPTDREAWGAGYPANGRAVQFEQVEVYGRDNFARELTNAAYYTAYKMKEYGMLPSLNGANGNLFSHHMVSQYLGGTDHTDPDAYWNNRAFSYFGTSYTIGDFFELVKYEYKQL